MVQLGLLPKHLQCWYCNYAVSVGDQYRYLLVNDFHRDLWYHQGMHYHNCMHCLARSLQVACTGQSSQQRLSSNCPQSLNSFLQPRGVELPLIRVSSSLLFFRTRNRQLIVNGLSLIRFFIQCCKSFGIRASSATELLLVSARFQYLLFLNQSSLLSSRSVEDCLMLHGLEHPSLWKATKFGCFPLQFDARISCLMAASRTLL